MRNWTTIKEFEEIKVRIFRRDSKNHHQSSAIPQRVYARYNKKMIEAMVFCRDSQDIATIILTGEGDKAFCSGGDINVKQTAGYIGKMEFHA